MDQYLQDDLAQSVFRKDEASPEKWKTVSEISEATDTKYTDSFDCNICLDSVQEPVVTLCGHLYCWPCIYKWIHYQNASDEYIETQLSRCPVCKTEVSEKNLVPLFGPGKTIKFTERNSHDVDVPVPRRPIGLRCGTQIRNPTQELNHGVYPYSPQPTLMPGVGRIRMENGLGVTSSMFGEMVYARMFGNSRSSSYPCQNSYTLAGLSTRRGRRQAMEAERSLTRVLFFLSCCAILCLLLF